MSLNNKDVHMVHLPTSACLIICSSAVETFPDECVGMLFSSYAVKDSIAKIESASPYQKARRTSDYVQVLSEARMEILLRNEKWFLIGEFHSHPFESYEKATPLEPSSVDLNDWPSGHLEIIVQARRVRKKKSKLNVKEIPGGAVEVLWKNFSFLLKAFFLTNKRKRQYHEACILIV